MDVVLLIAVIWIVALPAATVSALLFASMLSRRSAERLAGDLAPVVPLRPRAGTRSRRVA